MGVVLQWRKAVVANRAWKVRANSFSRPDYEIEGVNVRDAVHRNVGRILGDTAPWLSEDDVLSMDLRWRTEILGGIGGAELGMHVASESGMTGLVVWIGASGEELPPLTVWQRSGTSLRIISSGRQTRQAAQA